MKLKRLGSIFLAAAMMTAALTGCGGGDSKAEGGDSKAEGGKSTGYPVGDRLGQRPLHLREADRGLQHQLRIQGSVSG